MNSKNSIIVSMVLVLHALVDFFYESVSLLFDRISKGLDLGFSLVVFVLVVSPMLLQLYAKKIDVDNNDVITVMLYIWILCDLSFLLIM